MVRKKQVQKRKHWPNFIKETDVIQQHVDLIHHDLILSEPGIQVSTSSQPGRKVTQEGREMEFFFSVAISSYSLSGGGFCGSVPTKPV